MGREDEAVDVVVNRILDAERARSDVRDLESHAADLTAALSAIAEHVGATWEVEDSVVENLLRVQRAIRSLHARIDRAEAGR